MISTARFPRSVMEYSTLGGTTAYTKLEPKKGYLF